MHPARAADQVEHRQRGQRCRCCHQCLGSLAYYPLYQRLFCMLEVESLGQHGMPVLNANVVQDIVQRG